MKGHYALERCEKVLIEMVKECGSECCGSANYNSGLNEMGSCEKGSLYLELNETA